MLRLLKHLKWYHLIFFIIIIILVYVQVSLDLQLPEYMNEINTNIGKAMMGFHVEEKALTDVGLKMLYIALASLGCIIIVGYFSGILGAQFATILRDKVFKKVESFSLEEMEKFSTASLITRTTNDIRQVGMVTTMILRIATAAPLMAIKAILKIVDRGQELTFVVVASTLFLVISVVIIFFIVYPKFKKMQTLADRLNLVTRENLTGLRVIRALNAVEEETNKFSKTNDDVRNNNTFVNRVVSLISPMMMLIMNGTILAIIWVGAIVIDADKLAPADVIEFQQYALQIVMSFLMLIMIFIMAPRAFVSANRINEVLNTNSKINDITNPINSFKSSGELEFKDVSLMYPDANESVICNINFRVGKGQSVAIIGSTGSGKSTLINLIPRFYDPTKGRVLVNGVDVKNISQKVLRNLIGYVPQQGILFNGTINDNLAFGKNDLTYKDAIEALEISQADFVNELDQKLDYHIAQGGKNISGGQRQRLAIARAIIKKPEFLIFDDSFSALDFKTDQKLRKALFNKTKDITKIIVAQRVGSIMDADLILVLEEGKIVGKGKHEELLKSCPVYYEIASSQLGSGVNNHA